MPPLQAFGRLFLDTDAAPAAAADILCVRLQTVGRMKQGRDPVFISVTLRTHGLPAFLNTRPNTGRAPAGGYGGKSESGAVKPGRRALPRHRHKRAAAGSAQK